MSECLRFESDIQENQARAGGEVSISRLLLLLLEADL